MPLGVVVLLSVLGTSMNSAGLLLQRQGVVLSCGRKFSYLKNPHWLVGLLVMTAGWGLYLISVARAPLFIIQPVQGAGLIVFVVFSIFVLKERVTPLEWTSVIFLVAGMVLLAAGTGDAEKSFTVSAAALAVYSAVILGLTAGFLLAGSRHGFLKKDLSFGSAAGLLIGLAAVNTKGMMTAAGRPGMVLAFAVFAVLVVGLNLAGLLLIQEGFGKGRAVIVVALQAALTGAVPVAGGFLVFGEHLTAGPAAFQQAIGLLFTLGGTVFLARYEGRGLDGVRR
jgi:multidrug transporter EmrE-like cation transporter